MTSKLEFVSSSKKTCTGAKGWINDYSLVKGYEEVEQTCDNLDNDCDAAIDEELGQSSCGKGIAEKCECNDGICNEICGDNYSAIDDPDCSCNSDNACCGINCDINVDNDCATDCGDGVEIKNHRNPL